MSVEAVCRNLLARLPCPHSRAEAANTLKQIFDIYRRALAAALNMRMNDAAGWAWAYCATELVYRWVDMCASSPILRSWDWRAAWDNHMMSLEPKKQRRERK